MRILQVIPYFSPNRGGDVNACYHLSVTLARLGHQVTIVTTDSGFDREYADSIEDENLRIIPFHCVVSLSSYFVSPGMKKWIKVNIGQYDVVHLHNFRSYQNNVTYRFAKKHGIPVILQPDASTQRVMSKRWLKWLYDIRYGYSMLRGATKVVAISEEEAAYDKKAGVKEENLVCLYTGMPIELFKNPPEYGGFRLKHGIDLNDLMILYLGRLHESKGIDHIIEAFGEIAANRKDIVLAIVGPDWGCRDKLETQASNLGLTDKVSFYGSVKEQEKISAFVDADLFVHTVRYMGGVGISPLEAILCGTPVVVTQQCGEIIRKADCGYIVRFNDIPQLASTMTRALNSPEETSEMVEKGQRYITQNLSWNKIAQGIVKIYEDSTRTH